MKIICQICKSPSTARPSAIAKGFGKFCSLSCSNRARGAGRKASGTSKYALTRYHEKMKDPVWANKKRAYRREEQKRNAHIWREKAMRRYADKLNATPRWLTDAQRSEIKKIYKNCPQGFHVDHIVPLKGATVRGLHVPWNLQYLPASENCRKGNRLAAS